MYSNRIESILRPFVYDSPVNAPMFENVHYLRPIFNVKTQQHRIDKHLRQLRTEFHENVTERLVSPIENAICIAFKYSLKCLILSICISGKG